MIPDEELHNMEEWAMKPPASLDKQNCAKLVSEVLRLRHELVDPRYLYVGRIHRQAILCRNAEIDSLREELAELQKQLKENKLNEDKK